MTAWMQVRLPPMNETEFRAQIIQLAEMYRWLVYFTWNSVNSPAGYPDLHCVRNSRSVFLELKIGKRKATWHQEVWLGALKAAGHECYLVRPEDWEFIVKLLSAEVRQEYGDAPQS
jgi:hypothetical protein